ncbi:MAG: metallophosphoesterase [Candidatus Pristimantibacillus sp.]
MRKLNWRKKLLIAIVIAACLIGFLYSQNNLLVTTKMTINSPHLPQSFDGYRIVQLSDLHSKSFGKNQRILAKKVHKLKPDLIVFTGDLVDQQKYDEQTSLALMQQMVEIAPVYYVTGNHEWWSGNYASLEKGLTRLGVHVMRNTHEVIKLGGESIYIAGVDDPAVHIGQNDRFTVEEEIKASIQGINDENSYLILLSHRPELFSLYEQYGIDMVMSGHAHGGQFRLPFLGGIIAPDQGLLPDYTSGKYSSSDTTMIVSRGLGNSIIPQRIFNLPEIIAVTLSNKAP